MILYLWGYSSFWLRELRDCCEEVMAEAGCWAGVVIGFCREECSVDFLPEGWVAWDGCMGRWADIVDGLFFARS